MMHISIFFRLLFYKLDIRLFPTIYLRELFPLLYSKYIKNGSDVCILIQLPHLCNHVSSGHII